MYIPIVYLPAIVHGAGYNLVASCEGGTSLSGTSDQSFTEVPATKYEAAKEVRLRLVCASDQADKEARPLPESWGRL